MKLRMKIILIFGVTVLFTILLAGGIAVNSSFSSSVKNVKDNVELVADLASEQISGRLKDYENMAIVSGKDELLSSDESVESKTAVIDKNAVDYGFVSGNILDDKGVSIKDGTDFSDREYVKKALAGEANISDITLSKYTNTYGFSIAAPIIKEESSVGVIYYRVDIDFMLEVIECAKTSDNAQALIIDKDGNIIVHPEQDKILTENIIDTASEYKDAIENIGNGNGGCVEYLDAKEKMICGYAPIEGTDGWGLLTIAPESDFTGEIFNSIKKSIVVDIVILVIAIFIAISLGGYIGASVKKVEKVLVKLENGDLSSDIQRTTRKDEIGVLQNSAYELQNTFSEIINDTNNILGSMARYDLCVSDMKNYPGTYNELAASVNNIKNILQGLIAEVQASASSVGVGSEQLASAADALSQGTVSQASSIDQVVADVEEVAEKIDKNSQNEIVVEERLKNLGKLINNGNDQMTELLNVVTEVEAMSADIQKIVGAIDTIAFQTNILALNASVEAARAGENGKGFAVVADEVGALASKTSEASKETSELIGKCIVGISNATECANATFACLNEIVKDSGEIAAAFETISVATREQATKASNIKTEINNISDVVQTNTATAEETAAATQELSDQARSLSGLVRQFKL